MCPQEGLRHSEKLLKTLKSINGILRLLLYYFSIGKRASKSEERLMHCVLDVKRKKSLISKLNLSKTKTERGMKQAVC